MAKVIVQIVIQGMRVVGRSFGRALKQEYEASQQAAKARASSSSQQHSSDSSSPFGTSISLDEAVKILNVEKPLDPERIQKNYDHLFAINDKATGGSFYLQSKVVRAKERIDAEMMAAQQASQTKNESSSKDTGQS